MSAEAPELLPAEMLAGLAREHGTPLYVYDLAAVLERLDQLVDFDIVRYAQKANSNLTLLVHLARAGVAVDAVSAGEILRALKAGFAPTDIVYTADIFDAEALELVARHGLHANLGSADMIEQLAERVPGAAVTLRVNPGFGGGHDRKVHCGGPTSKHGVWYADLPATLERARRAGLTVTGVHAHIGSGSDGRDLARLATAMDSFVETLEDDLQCVSCGGGLPVPYRPGEPVFDVRAFGATWRKARARWEERLGRRLTLEVEPGRYLVARAGVLLTEVRATKSTAEHDWVLVDAGFHTLARPMLYGAYHHVSAPGHAGEPCVPQVVAGPLCEAADVFTQDKAGRPEPRPLPRVRPGDLLCVHDVGAYGASMASNYNSRPLPAEVLVVDGEARLVRQRQTLEELLAGEVEARSRTRQGVDGA